MNLDIEKYLRPSTTPISGYGDMDELLTELDLLREWAEANIYEVPITMPDVIGNAIETLKRQYNELYEKVEDND